MSRYIVPGFNFKLSWVKAGKFINVNIKIDNEISFSHQYFGISQFFAIQSGS